MKWQDIINSVSVYMFHLRQNGGDVDKLDPIVLYNRWINWSGIALSDLSTALLILRHISALQEMPFSVLREALVCDHLIA